MLCCGRQETVSGMRGFATIAVLAAALMAAPASAQNYGLYGAGAANGDNYGPTEHQSPPDDADHPVSRDAVAVAQDLRLKGQCDKAVPMLRRLAGRGAGYEISQFDLGLCLFDLAKKTTDAAQAADMRKEAAQWIVTAANGGFAKAQAKAVTLYLDATGVAADPVEAQKWALLYRANGSRLAIGLPDIPADVTTKLDSELNDAQRKEARARVKAFVPVTMEGEE
jgi:hypothetical protein